MINYKDLMIGNWVYESERSKFPMRVVNVGEDYCYLDFDGNQGDVFECKDKDMMPIEITEELLLKNGFIPEIREWFSSKIYSMVIGEYTLRFDSTEIPNGLTKCYVFDKNFDISGSFYFTYLHELQNGIRLIAKSDLEFKEL